MDKLLDTVGCGLNYVGTLDIELLAVGEESVGVELRDFEDSLVLALCARDHLVLAGVSVAREVTNVGDVHNALYVVAREAQVLLEHVLHNVGAEVADVGVVVDGGAAGVHIDLVAVVGNEFLLCLSERVI